ncbi:hypothetical protein PAXRUDRAFT_71220, partial [Paxillus rubicundulus Ve08.2h10]
LINALHDFAQHGSQCLLWDFQCIAGHFNWVLNAYLMLRPGLCVVYAKTVGKLHQKALMWVNWDVQQELQWVIDHASVLTSKGVYLLKSISW